MFKKVSVIIPTYNRPKVLLKSIETVMNQTYPGEIEIIIIDDSKKSQKEEIFKKFNLQLKRLKNRKIKYIYAANPRGSPLARNIGINESTGEYIAFLDDDDEWLAGKIEKQVKVMEKYENVGLVICYSLDKRFGKERISKPPENITHEIILKAFNLSSSSSYLIKKRAIEDVEGFDIYLPSAQEYDLAIRLSKNYSVRCLTEVLMIQNETKGQISENWSRKIKGILYLYKKHKNEYSFLKFPENLLYPTKVIGLIILFSFGYILGNRIHVVLTPFKQIYEK